MSSEKKAILLDNISYFVVMYLRFGNCIVIKRIGIVRAMPKVLRKCFNCTTHPFKWPKSATEAMTLTPEQYRMLMQDMEIVAKRPIQEVQDPSYAMWVVQNVENKIYFVQQKFFIQHIISDCPQRKVLLLIEMSITAAEKFLLWIAFQNTCRYYCFCHIFRNVIHRQNDERWQDAMAFWCHFCYNRPQKERSRSWHSIHRGIIKYRKQVPAHPAVLTTAGTDRGTDKRSPRHKWKDAAADGTDHPWEKGEYSFAAEAPIQWGESLLSRLRSLLVYCTDSGFNP